MLHLPFAALYISLALICSDRECGGLAGPARSGRAEYSMDALATSTMHMRAPRAHRQPSLSRGGDTPSPWRQHQSRRAVHGAGGYVRVSGLLSFMMQLRVLIRTRVPKRTLL